MSKRVRRVDVVVDEELYQQIRVIAHKQGCSMAEIGRQYLQTGVNGVLTKENMDFIAPIIRKVLEEVLKPSIDRLASLNVKTCIQAGTSAYLNAEALARLVPIDLQMELSDAYGIARKKAIQYVKQPLNIIQKEYESSGEDAL